MAYDRNPKFGEDHAFADSARRVADLLWETTGGDLSSYPPSYLETLSHQFAEGQLSMLDLIDKVDLGPDATYDDYCEVVDALMDCDGSFWPDKDGIVELYMSHIQHEVEPEEFFDFGFDFAEEVVEEEVAVEETGIDPLSEKMELFFKKVISSVYLDGVTGVTDAQGNPPTAANNYLMAPDGKSFSGVFYDAPPNQKARKYPFVISENEKGTWQITY